MSNSGPVLPGQLGATYFIPTFIVRLLMITHIAAIYLLVRPLHRQATA